MVYNFCNCKGEDDIHLDIFFKLMGYFKGNVYGEIVREYLLPKEKIERGCVNVINMWFKTLEDYNFFIEFSKYQFLTLIENEDKETEFFLRKFNIKVDFYVGEAYPPVSFKEDLIFYNGIKFIINENDITNILSNYSTKTLRVTYNKMNLIVEGKDDESNIY